MTAVLLEVYADDTPERVLFYMGVIGNVWFPIPDDTATPANGWHLVRCSERVWQSYAGRHTAQTRVNVWSGLPEPLNPDGTFKNHPK